MGTTDPNSERRRRYIFHALAAPLSADYWERRWHRIELVVIEALTKFPEAYKAVVQALRRERPEDPVPEPC